MALLEGSVPVQLIQAFRRQLAQGQAAGFVPKEQLADLYNLLQSWQEQPTGDAAASENANEVTIANVLTLGDYWLTNAIQQGWLRPLNLREIPAWQTLASQEIWQTLVQRDRQGQPSPDGEIWAAPYRWGTLMMVYRAEQFKDKGWAAPTDWDALWRPELKRQISLLDSPRSVIGLTLKKLGRSINTTDLDAVADLKAELQALNQQVKFYSSDSYLQALVVEDTQLAVGWSNEILPLLKRNRQLAAAVPASGTILTADLWVQPAQAPSVEPTEDRPNLLNQWLSFCWDDEIATQLSLLSLAASPLFYGKERSQLPELLQESDLLLPPAEILRQSEFLLPLSEAAINQYRRLWVEVRAET
ncbi:MAG: extracellular solute-binding protein [Elainellaceae cyanobacterium]